MESPPIRIGIAGDYDPTNPTHTAIDAALGHAASWTAQHVEARWLPSDALATDQGAGILAACHALWIAPGSPYRSMDGVLNAIRFAREGGVPLLGTCGGFQHIVIEFARNVLGVRDAGHAELHPYAPDLFITPLACALVGEAMDVTLHPASRAHACYAAEQITEFYYCSFGLNPAFIPDLTAAGLRIAGSDADGEPRIIELPDHPFYLGTLFLPQARSTPDAPHPLIVALFAAATHANQGHKEPAGERAYSP